MLPITVAFLVGGKAGSLVGVKEFQLIPAIGWAVVIGIIDFNFSIVKKLGALGWIGRMVLVLTSAIITATIGDHIIFADSIKEERDKIAGESPEIAEKTITWEKATQSVKEIDALKAKLKADLVKETSGQSGSAGYGPEARSIERQITDATADLTYLRGQLKIAKDELDSAKANRNKSHNIIEEIQLLYKLIFESFASACIFILLSLMVICIETLPLILKGAKTAEQIKAERDAELAGALHSKRESNSQTQKSPF